MLKWSEYASGGRVGEPTRQRSGSLPDRRVKNQARMCGVARKSTPDVDGHNPAIRRVQFEGDSDRDARGGC